METIGSRPFRRRATRASIVNGIGSCELLCENLGSCWIPVRCIAELGAGLDISALAQPPAPNSVLEGRLFFEDKVACSVKLRIVYVRGGLAGIEFIEPSTHLRILVKHFFQLELLGAGMRSDHVDGNGVKALRYTDQKENRVEILVKDDEIYAFFARLPEVEMEMAWTEPSRREDASDSVAPPKELFRLFHNLPDLDTGIREQLARVFGTA